MRNFLVDDDIFCGNYYAKLLESQGFGKPLVLNSGAVITQKHWEME